MLLSRAGRFTFAALTAPFIIASAVTVTTNCTPKQADDARGAADVVLPLKDLACVMGSVIVDPHELQLYCRLADKLLPLIRELIGFREAGRRAGVVWRDPTDAGADGAP